MDITYLVAQIKLKTDKNKNFQSTLCLTFDIANMNEPQITVNLNMTNL